MCGNVYIKCRATQVGRYGFPAGNPRVNIHLLWKFTPELKHAFYMVLGNVF